MTKQAECVCVCVCVRERERERQRQREREILSIIYNNKQTLSCFDVRLMKLSVDTPSSFPVFFVPVRTSQLFYEPTSPVAFHLAILATPPDISFTIFSSIYNTESDEKL